jgi:hypothetical protein
VSQAEKKRCDNRQYPALQVTPPVQRIHQPGAKDNLLANAGAKCHKREEHPLARRSGQQVAEIGKEPGLATRSVPNSLRSAMADDPHCHDKPGDSHRQSNSQTVNEAVVVLLKRRAPPRGKT